MGRRHAQRMFPRIAVHDHQIHGLALLQDEIPGTICPRDVRTAGAGDGVEGERAEDRRDLRGVVRDVVEERAVRPRRRRVEDDEERDGVVRRRELRLGGDRHERGVVHVVVSVCAERAEVCERGGRGVGDRGRDVCAGWAVSCMDVNKRQMGWETHWA